MSEAAGSLRVLHVITGLGQGGAESVLCRLVESTPAEVRHTVISLTDEGVYADRLRRAGATVLALGMAPGRFSVRAFQRLRGYIRGSRPQVVQTWMYHADLLGGLAARMSGVPAVAWGIRNSGAHLARSSLSARLVMRVCAWLSRRVPAAIVCCAEDARRRHVQAGYAAAPMVVIPNGYDLARLRPDAQARIAVRRELGLDEDTPLIGCVARWDPLKDHANLVRALAVLREAGSVSGLRCVLVGRGMTPDNAELAALLAEHGVAGQVLLLGPREDVPAIMSALDLHVLPSRAEGFPNVVAEAMACGTPCVVTDAGDAAAIVGDHGWVVPIEDPRALAAAIALAFTTLADPDARAKLSQGARERVQHAFSLPAMAQAYHALWLRLAGQSSPKPQAAGSVAAALPPAVSPGGQRTVRVMFVVNNPDFFVSHRLPLALAAREAGYEVHVATMDGPGVRTIVSHGLLHHVVPMTRSGKNPWQELRTVTALCRLMSSVRPDLVHLVTIKPVLYGGLAARLAGVPAMVAAIAGLGYVFTRQSRGVDPLRWAVAALYRLALKHRNARVVCQNGSDRDVLVEMGAVQPEQVVMIRGSGVDLDLFRPAPEPEGVVTAVMAARLLRDKGVYEFIEAARRLHERGVPVRLRLAGSPDPGNPASVDPDDLARWRHGGLVDILGERKDVAALYANANIVVLPSYREGLPKSLIEAAACGRPVVTTDVPGCRDAIEPGTGLLVPPRDAVALADAIERLVNDRELRRRMGRAGRELAEREFDIRKVVDAHMRMYAQLLEAIYWPASSRTQ